MVFRKLLTLSLCLSYGWSQQLFDWQSVIEFDRPLQKHIISKSGVDVEFVCPTKGKYHSNYYGKNNRIIWQYQKCDDPNDPSSCSHLFEKSEENWKLVNCTEYNTCSGRKLVLINVTSHDSGFYRCSFLKNNSTSPIRNIYNLEVIKNAERPHVLELSPENLTIYEGSSAMFRCQAVSNIHADFRWFRKHDNLTNMQVIIYENNPYEPLNSSGQIAVSHNTYLSKFVLPMASEQDSREYFCLAANALGYDFKEAHLTVLPRKINSSLLHQGVDSSLHLLFLIPVIMGIVPTTVWLIYIKLRKNKLDATSQASSSNNATVRNVERNSSWQNSNSERKVKYHVVKELVT